MTGDEVLEILRTPSRKDRYLELFDKLNPMGQRIAVERVEELTEIPKYQRQETPLEVPQAPPEGTGDIPLPESLSEGAETLPESQEVDWGKPQGDEVW